MSTWDNAKNAALIEKLMRFQVRNRVLTDDLPTVRFLIDLARSHPHAALMEQARILQNTSGLYTRPTLLALALWVLDDLPRYFKLSKKELQALGKIAPVDSEAAHCVHLARMYHRLCYREGLLLGSGSKGEKP